ncbi:MAG: cupredoxin domain-containing protein [Endomicrobiales bacterium]
MFNLHGAPGYGGGRKTAPPLFTPVSLSAAKEGRGKSGAGALRVFLPCPDARRAPRGAAWTVLALLACLLGACSSADGPSPGGQQQDETNGSEFREKDRPELISAPRGRPAARCSLVIDPLSDMYYHTRSIRPFSFYSRGRPAGTRRRGDTVRELDLEAFRFGFSPSHMVFKKGETIRLLATSRDVPHSVCIREYGIDVPVNKGEVKRIEFAADRAGEFIVECSVYCGPGYKQMRARLVIEE